MTDWGSRPCVICHRPLDDVLHDDERDSRQPVRIKQHAYDPGERRHWTRRHDDLTEHVDRDGRRQSVRRMEDRVELVERAARRVG